MMLRVLNPQRLVAVRASGPPGALQSVPCGSRPDGADAERRSNTVDQALEVKAVPAGPMILFSGRELRDHKATETRRWLAQRTCEAHPAKLGDSMWGGPSSFTTFIGELAESESVAAQAMARVPSLFIVGSPKRAPQFLQGSIAVLLRGQHTRKARHSSP